MNIKKLILILQIISQIIRDNNDIDNLKNTIYQNILNHTNYLKSWTQP